MTEQTGPLTTVLPGEATSPGLARRFVAEALAPWAPEELRESAQLLTSELVTNVVLHVRGDLILRVHRLPERLRVEVSDASPAMPRRAVLFDDDAEGATGRGLLLVEALASDWGAEQTEDGKVVWFEVAQ